MPTSSNRPRAIRAVTSIASVLGLVVVVTVPSLTIAARSGDARLESPASPHGDLALPCSQCHNAQGWKPAEIKRDFDHAAYGFALDGAHAVADCSFCHRSLEFESLSPECSSCHQDVHSGSFGVDCEQCHRTRSFIDRSDQLSMHQISQFPLTGRHGSLDCDQCHTVGSSGTQFVNTPSECFQCHRADYQTAAAPDHVQAGFGTDCTECHGTVAWAGGNMNSHDMFPLKGGHAGLECQSCHVTGQFSRIDAGCVSCHRPDYDATSQPAHQPAGFTTDCEGCHTIQTWNGGAFDHASTAFSLTGAHVGLECGQCHVQASYAATPSACNGCHNADYVSATEPNHVTGRFPLECEVCHSTVTWTGATFDHSLSSFPLTGGHRTVECTQCHVGGAYTGTRSDCYACHRADYDATSDPVHAPAGFGIECEVCHSTSNWTDATFDHDSSWFPIYSGSHRNEWNDCNECHTNAANFSVYDCLSCHEHSNKSKVDGDHRGENGYRYDSVACYDCHPRGRE